MKYWIRKGYTQIRGAGPCGEPAIIYTNYNNFPIKYIFNTCRIHNTTKCNKGKEVKIYEKT